MSIKYKMVQRRVTPNDTESEKKWYATPNSEAPLSVRKISQEATANTTLSAVELEVALELLGKFIPKQLLQGHTVPIPGIGYFRLTFKSNGVESVKDFKPGQMIYDVRPVFVVNKELRESIKGEVEFTDGGVKIGDINYATRKDYYLGTGQQVPVEDDDEETTGGGSGSQGGGSSTPSGGGTGSDTTGGSGEE